MINKLPLLILICLVLAVGGFAQDEPVKEAKKKDPETYGEMLKRVKSGDKNVDFKAMRLAYADTDQYSPYGCKTGRNEMIKAVNEKKYKDALKHSNGVLDYCYVDMNAHLVATIAHKELEDDEKSAFHNGVYMGLIRSIIDDGDGKSTKTAWTVISVDEEYTVLAALGYRRTMQSLLNDNGSKFDRLDAVNIDDENETASFYFNVDVVFKGYTKMFKS